MIKIPFMVLTYGDSKTLKLFAYEIDKKLVLPIFFSGDVAYKFICSTRSSHSRALTIQVCSKLEDAKAIFRHISISSIEHTYVSIDQKSLEEESLLISLDVCLSSLASNNGFEIGTSPKIL